MTLILQKGDNSRPSIYNEGKYNDFIYNLFINAASGSVKGCLILTPVTSSVTTLTHAVSSVIKLSVLPKAVRSVTTLTNLVSGFIKIQPAVSQNTELILGGCK